MFLLNCGDLVCNFTTELIQEVETRICFFFSPNIKKQLDFMKVQSLSANIYLSNVKLRLKCFFKTSDFHPTRIPDIKKKKKHTTVFQGDHVV